MGNLPGRSSSDNTHYGEQVSSITPAATLNQQNIPCQQSQRRNPRCSSQAMAQPIQDAVVWEKRFKQLSDYKDAHGHCRVPMCYQENQPLASWARGIRGCYKKYQNGKNTSLTTEQIARLDDLGFEWELLWSPLSRKKIPWQTRIEELKEYKEVNGHCRVPRYLAENQSFANWVANMRLQYAKLKKGEKSTITKERIAELNRLGFEWSGRRKKEDSSGTTGILPDAGEETEENHQNEEGQQQTSAMELDDNNNRSKRLYRRRNTTPFSELENLPSAKKQRMCKQERAIKTDTHEYGGKSTNSKHASASSRESHHQASKNNVLEERMKALEELVGELKGENESLREELDEMRMCRAMEDGFNYGI